MSQTKSGGSVRKFVTGVIATGALLVLYLFSTIAVTSIVMTAGSDSAMAARGGGRGGGRGVGRGVGRGRGGGRGFVRGGRGFVRGGRGRGFWRGGVWFPLIAPGYCHEVLTSRRFVCPY